MFHTYVVTSCGTQVDFDRAAFLMDPELLHTATIQLEDRIKRGPELFDIMVAEEVGDSPWTAWTIERRAQFVWDDYCAQHYDEHNEEFAPDVDPNWGG